MQENNKYIMTHWYRNYQTLLEYNNAFEISKELHNEVVKLVWDDLGNNGDLDRVEDEYRRENDSDYQYPNDDEGEGDTSEIDTSSPEFKEWFSDWVEERYSEAEWEISKLIQDGKITLYRCIMAPKDWKPNADRHIGIYWSWSEAAAAAHWGDYSGDNISWLIKGETPVEYIDWAITLAMNASTSFDEEKEVRLKDNAPVTVLGYKAKK